MPYTNHLASSTSPYLLQHATNPIDWYPWGEEAIERARREDKPIFISIGYSTCYWCHVMEREVFCDPQVGNFINQCFINIKIDREERPDLDETYMAARQLLTRQGGWPNNLLLTPALKPFWAAGTLLAGNEYGPSFSETMLWLADAWQHKRDTIEKSANELTAYLTLQLTETTKKTTASNDALGMLLFQKLQDVADSQHGGFFNAPKFPHETYLLFLLDYYRRMKQPQILAMVTTTLDALAAGGIYDHIGGGFHRYAVDNEWKVPHFEKMLYNQARLGQCYAEAYAITGNPYYRYIASSTYDFVHHCFTSPEGGFYSALDAETDEVEGAYYAWTDDAIRTTLFHDQYAFFAQCFTLADIPHFEGHKHPDGGVIVTSNPSIIQQLPPLLASSIQRLRWARNKRPLPSLDTKIIAAWHGMMMQSLAVAGKLLSNHDYEAAAEKAAAFVEHHLLDQQGRLLRIADNGSIPGFLEDYAHIIAGLLALYDTTNHPHHLSRATWLMEKCCIEMEDTVNGGFFTSVEQTNSLLRIKTASDDALPAANAIMLQNLLQLGKLTGNHRWLSKAEQVFAAFSSEAERSPMGYAAMIHSAESLQKELTVQAEIIHILPVKGSNDLMDISIQLTIQPGWHITASTLQLSSTALTIHHLHVPETSLEYYEGSIVINAQASIDDSKKHNGNELLLHYAPCDHQSCYPARTLTVSLPIHEMLHS